QDFTYAVLNSLLDARSTWIWFQSRWPSRHLAVLPDGKVLAETWQFATLPLLDPRSGAWSAIGVPSPASTGYAPNPIVWADRSTGYVIGAVGDVSVIREDGVLKWNW